MRHIFIINPKAGKLNATGALRTSIEQCMMGRSDPYEIITTVRPMHAADIAREKAREAAEGGEPCRIYACGGDGTMNEVLNGAYGFANTAITNLPCGTGNDFLRLFGEHRERFFDVNELVDGEEMALDVIDANGQYSVNICSVGFDAKVAAEVHRFSRLPLVNSYGAFTISVMYNLLKGLHRRYDVIVDGKDLSGRYTLLVAANARYYGGGYNPTPEADPADGLIDFLLIGEMSRFEVLNMIKHYSSGQYQKLGDKATYIRGTKMTVACTDGIAGAPAFADANVDGEGMRSNAFTFKLAADKIRFVVPKGAQY